jgi:hypothetical protein
MRTTLFHGLALALIFSLLSSVAIGDESDWLVAPPVVKEVNPADRQARDAIVKLIAERQAKESRTGWALTVPQRASGVPAKYDLLLHRGSGCFSEAQARLEVQVRDGMANFELADKTGIYRLQRPSQEIDQFARKLTYAFHAEEVKQDKLSSVSSFSIGPPPHDVEIVSQDEKFPFHLQPRFLQADENTRGDPTDRIRNHAFAKLTDFAFALLEKHGELLPAAEENREILRRLQQDKSPTIDKSVPIRVRIERDVFGGLAVRRQLAAALPELKRLQLVDEYRQLEIASAADPEQLVQKAIAAHETDRTLAAWACKFAADEQNPERLQWLIDVLPRLDVANSRESFDDVICFYLKDRKLTPEQVAQLSKRFSDTKQLKLKIELANILLQQTHEESFFRYLTLQVRTLPPERESYPPSPRTTAAEYLCRYAADTGKKRAEAREVLLKVLEEPRRRETPDSFEMRELVELLGKLGTERDLPYLAKLAESKSVYLAGSAVQAMADISPSAGLQQLHQRLEKYNQQPIDRDSPDHDYSHEVFSHFELIVFERDVAAAPLLKKAWERLNAAVKANVKTRTIFDQQIVDEPEPISAGYDPTHVIAFLEAKTGAARAEAAIAHFGDRAYLHDKARMQKLVKQLVAEGADPIRCQELLRNPHDEEEKRGR